jgi:RNA-directed DNA polymerase
VQQRYIKQLRMWLYYWERYGYERASGFFLQQYVTDKGHVKNGKPDMANVIAGKLDYLKMVKGTENELYLKLKGRFDKLIGYGDPINQLLDVWESDGIDRAMEFYYRDKTGVNGKE